MLRQLVAENSFGHKRRLKDFELADLIINKAKSNIVAQSFENEQKIQPQSYYDITQPSISQSKIFQKNSIMNKIRRDIKMRNPNLDKQEIKSSQQMNKIIENSKKIQKKPSQGEQKANEDFRSRQYNEFMKKMNGNFSKYMNMGDYTKEALINSINHNGSLIKSNSIIESKIKSLIKNSQHKDMTDAAEDIKKLISKKSHQKMIQHYNIKKTDRKIDNKEQSDRIKKILANRNSLAGNFKKQIDDNPNRSQEQTEIRQEQQNKESQYLIQSNFESMCHDKSSKNEIVSNKVKQYPQDPPQRCQGQNEIRNRQQKNELQNANKSKIETQSSQYDPLSTNQFSPKNKSNVLQEQNQAKQPVLKKDEYNPLEINQGNQIPQQAKNKQLKQLKEKKFCFKCDSYHEKDNHRFQSKAKPRSQIEQNQYQKIQSQKKNDLLQLYQQNDDEIDIEEQSQDSYDYDDDFIDDDDASLKLDNQQILRQESKIKLNSVNYEKQLNMIPQLIEILTMILIIWKLDLMKSTVQFFFNYESLFMLI